MKTISRNKQEIQTLIFKNLETINNIKEVLKKYENGPIFREEIKQTIHTSSHTGPFFKYHIKKPKLFEIKITPEMVYPIQIENLKDPDDIFLELIKQKREYDKIIKEWKSRCKIGRLILKNFKNIWILKGFEYKHKKSKIILIERQLTKLKKELVDHLSMDIDLKIELKNLQIDKANSHCKHNITKSRGLDWCGFGAETYSGIGVSYSFDELINHINRNEENGRDYY